MWSIVDLNMFGYRVEDKCLKHFGDHRGVESACRVDPVICISRKLGMDVGGLIALLVLRLKYVFPASLFVSQSVGTWNLVPASNPLIIRHSLRYEKPVVHQRHVQQCHISIN
jgi:hypothetical protein